MTNVDLNRMRQHSGRGSPREVSVEALFRAGAPNDRLARPEPYVRFRGAELGPEGGGALIERTHFLGQLG